MRSKLSNWILILLIPSILEAIGNVSYIIPIPGFPLSLGRLSFVIAGFAGIFVIKKEILKNPFFLSAIFLIAGLFLASIFMNEGIGENLSRVTGFALLFIGSIGVANFWHVKLIKNSLDVYFIALFIYWAFAITVKVLFDRDFGNYAESFQQGEVVNHHIPGMLLSVSCAYITLRYFNKHSKLKIIGFLLFILTALVCVLIGSRSNLLITFLILIVILGKNKITFKRIILVTLPILFFGFFIGKGVVLQDEYLTRRFTGQDPDYQKRTTDMRVHYISIAIKDFIEKPFGKGINKAEVVYRGRTQFVHNQYLSFILSGGILGLIGVIFLLYGILANFRGLRLYAQDEEVMSTPQINAYNIASLTFFFTLLTIESTGIFFFLMFSIAIFTFQNLRILNTQAY